MAHVEDMTIDADSTSRVELTKRDLQIIEIAKQTAIGMKKSATAHNIRRSQDYIDALTFTGLLVQKNMPPDRSGAPDFLDILEEMTPIFRSIVEERQIRDADDALADMQDQIGVVDQSPSDMIVNLGLTAEGVLLDISQSYDLDKRETMQVLSFAIIFAQLAAAPEDERTDALASLLLGARERVEHWDAFVPSDDEMFGDLFDDEEDEDDEDDGSPRH